MLVFTANELLQEAYKQLDSGNDPNGHVRIGLHRLIVGLGANEQLAMGTPQEFGHEFRTWVVQDLKSAMTLTADSKEAVLTMVNKAKDEGWRLWYPLLVEHRGNAWVALMCR